MGVPEDATVADVKYAYLKLMGVPIAHQNLYFQKTGPLESAKKLVEYQISSGATLSLLGVPPFEVNVISEESLPLRLIVDPTDRLKDLKKQIEEGFGIPLSSQVLRLRKRRLKGNLTLAEYGLKDGCSVEVVAVRSLS